jgi:hypothetical protein
MRHIKTFEDINIPINVGDTILGGRFKNKKTIVKKIGKNAKGDITVNGKPLLKYRLVKEAASYESFKEETDEILSPITYSGFTYRVEKGSTYRTQIYYGNSKSYDFECPEFEWDEIRADVQAYIGYMVQELDLEIIFIYTIGANAGPSHGFARTQHTEEEILNDKELGMIKCICIEFKN